MSRASEGHEAIAGRRGGPQGQSRLDAFGWDRQWAQAFGQVAPAGTVPGRVVRGGKDRVLVATEQGDDLAGAAELPVAGDWVALEVGGEDDDPRCRVVAVLPRRSTLVRHRSRGVARPQVLAANADVVFVAASLDKPLNPARLDREIVTAWQSGAEPVVVLTKADRAGADLDTLTQDLSKRLGRHHRIVVTSAHDGRGIDQLRAELSTTTRPHATAVLFGPSGSGKSTLANALIGRQVAQTRAVRPGDLKGRHTTTNRHLLPVPGGGLLIDTPGLRSMGLWEVGEGLFKAFGDLEQLATGCRFSSCTHTGEPGCAVRDAIVNGEIDAARVASWKKLNEEFDSLVAPEAQAMRRRPRQPRRR